MLRINGNRLSAEGIEFMLPNDFYIDIGGMESVDKNGLRLVPKEKDCFIWMRTETDEYKTAMESLLDAFSDFVCQTGSEIELFEDPSKSEYQWIDKPNEYEKNGLRFASSQYTALKTDVYRLHFEKVTGFNERYVIFMQVDRTKTDLKTVLARLHVHDFFESICLAKE